MATQLYSKAYEYIRKYDTNHLIFGDRYKRSDIPDVVVRADLPYVDAISTQPHNRLDLEYFKHIYETYEKPIYISDHVSSFATKEHPVTMGQVAENEEEYLEFYRSYIEKALALPYLVGYNKCLFTNEVRPTLLKRGIIQEDGSPYQCVPMIGNIHKLALRKIYGLDPLR